MRASAVLGQRTLPSDLRCVSTDSAMPTLMRGLSWHPVHSIQSVLKVILGDARPLVSFACINLTIPIEHDAHPHVLFLNSLLPLWESLNQALGKLQ